MCQTVATRTDVTPRTGAARNGTATQHYAALTCARAQTISAS